MQIMDDASRGPMGAARILTSLGLTGGTLATFSAVTTVLMVAFSPFLQQLLSYPLHEVEQKQLFAWAPQNFDYSKLFRDDLSDKEFFKVLEAGTWSTQKPLEPSCPTARCKWDNFKSVGWCTKCEDRTETAVLSDCNSTLALQTLLNTSSSAVSCTFDFGQGRNISLAEPPAIDDKYPDGLHKSISFIRESIWLVASGTLRSSLFAQGLNITKRPDFDRRFNVSFGGESYPLVVLGHVRSSMVNNETLPLNGSADIIHIDDASLCILSLCETEVAIETKDGEVHSTRSSPNYGSLLANDSYICWKSEEGNANVAKTYEDGSNRAFCFAERHASQIFTYLVGDLKKTAYSVRPRNGSHSSQPVRPATINTVGDKSARSLQERLENIATALTNYGLETTDTKIRGRAYAEETHVKVRWWWILLPALLQLSTLILFTTTVVYSHLNGIPIWKSSILAIIYHGVEDLDEKKDLTAERLSGMNAVARMDEVQFSRSADGIHHLYGRSHR
jgi:hypothetical protein